jgi:micrococcal nuclease
MILLRAVLPLLLVAGCAAGTADRTAGEDASVAPGVPVGAQRGTVRTVFDGDTLVLSGIGSGPLRAGVDTKVRLLEVDTPEVSGGFVKGECFGPQASAFLKRLLPRGTVVHVTRDRDLLDRYDRTLLYVWLADGTFLNERLVVEGYATAVLFRPNDLYIARMRAAERTARSAGRGLWKACPAEG